MNENSRRITGKKKARKGDESTIPLKITDNIEHFWK
jgi:hypothetical protein